MSRPRHDRRREVTAAWRDRALAAERLLAGDSAHAFDLKHACRHLYRHADQCPVCAPVEVATDGTSWDRLYRTPGITPWYRTSDGELTWPAVLVILAVTGAAVLAALIVGQRWQDQRCAAAVGTATECVGWVA